ncbi:MAG: efflux transporter outer membrane subunit [Desulfohalobiaceae bacterium]|nr:efflux transporter outer membrane subunit [Desulfohalobiaceae bacterium]
MRRIPILLILVVLSGCTVFAPKQRDDPQFPVPERYSRNTRNGGVPDRWWEAFDSRELEEMVRTALRGNFDLKTAWARLEQARAVARKSGASAWPHLEGEAEGSREDRYQDSQKMSTSRDLSLSLAASYELDLWGRISSARKADRLSAQASWQEVQSSAVSVAAEVVTTWIDLRSVAREIDVVQDQIGTNKRLLERQRDRFLNGRAQALDVSQQKEALAASRTKLPGLRRRQRTLRNKMAVLLGRAPAGNLRVEGAKLPELIPLPETGIPMDLLSARPDIRAARLELASADWEVSAAKADLLPSISLSARGVLSGETLDAALSNWYTTLSATLAQTVFDAGQSRAEVSRKEAMAEEKLYTYSQTVIEAIQEVQDALAQEAEQRRLVSRIRERIRAAKSARRKARLRYLRGQEDYLTYLNQLENVQSLSRELVQERAQLLQYRVGLYRSLGADWTGSLERKKKAGSPQTGGINHSSEQKEYGG